MSASSPPILRWPGELLECIDVDVRMDMIRKWAIARAESRHRDLIAGCRHSGER